MYEDCMHLQKKLQFEYVFMPPPPFEKRGLSVDRSVDQAMSAQYLLTPLFLKVANLGTMDVHME